MVKQKTNKKKKQKFWFEHNQDAQGYKPKDNRAIDLREDRREVVRRTWNF